MESKINKKTAAEIDMARRFRTMLISKFKNAHQATRWDKAEVLDIIKDIWIEFLEEEYIR